MARVKLENVSKLYPGQTRPIVDRIDLDVQDREFLVLVGPSGCGKSTTLRMIAGLEDITSGQIWIGDRVVNDIPPKDRDIAMVFQNYALYPHMTVYKNMAFGLELRRRELNLTKAEIHKRVTDVAEVLGITEHLQRKPRVLSGGQKQRVALGRAIVRNPKAFLFDEPLSNLDAKLRVETRAEIKRLHLRLQTTTIYVTHDQEEAMTLGDRIVVMNAGIIQQVARPLEVYERPVNRFVASFIGTPPMNFLSGQPATAGYFVMGTQRLKLPSPLETVLNTRLGTPLVLGVRPESFSPGNIGKFAGDANALLGKVLLVEPLGDKMDIRFAADGIGDLLCRADAYAFRDIRPGQTASFYIDMSRAHLFEDGPEGKNLTPVPSPQ